MFDTGAAAPRGTRWTIRDEAVVSTELPDPEGGVEIAKQKGALLTQTRRQPAQAAACLGGLGGRCLGGRCPACVTSNH